MNLTVARLQSHTKKITRIFPRVNFIYLLYAFFPLNIYFNQLEFNRNEKKNPPDSKWIRPWCNTNFIFTSQWAPMQTAGMTKSNNFLFVWFFILFDLRVSNQLKFIMYYCYNFALISYIPLPLNIRNIYHVKRGCTPSFRIFLRNYTHSDFETRCKSKCSRLQ